MFDRARSLHTAAERRPDAPAVLRLIPRERTANQ
jgi:hypothetical protein